MACHIIQYIQQQSNRRHKPQEPINKLKDTEFFYMPQEIEVQSYPKKVKIW